MPYNTGRNEPADGEIGLRDIAWGSLWSYVAATNSIEAANTLALPAEWEEHAAWYARKLAGKPAAKQIKARSRTATQTAHAVAAHRTFWRETRGLAEPPTGASKRYFLGLLADCERSGRIAATLHRALNLLDIAEGRAL